MMLHIQSPNSQSSLTNVHDEDVQPNAVDLRLDKIFIITDSTFEIDNESKKHRTTFELPVGDDGFYTLARGTYEIVMENIIEVGSDEAGWVITRSTLNRNGLYITSGLYDSGYHGVMAGALHVTCGTARIKKGTRVGQFLLFKSEALKKYDGDYGLNKGHDQKYNKGQ